MGRRAGETSASKPRREKSVEGQGKKQVESRKVGRGGLGVTGTWSHHLATVLLPRAFCFW